MTQKRVFYSLFYVVAIALLSLAFFAGGTVKLVASLLYFLQVVVNFFLFRRDSSLWQRLSLVPFALVLLVSAIR